jgi:hypothetical protein
MRNVFPKELTMNESRPENENRPVVVPDLRGQDLPDAKQIDPLAAGIESGDEASLYAAEEAAREKALREAGTQKSD